MEFLRSQDGAVTVDWVVLTAALVGLGLATMSVVSSGVQDVSSDVNTQLTSNHIVSTNFATYQATAASITPDVYYENIADCEKGADPDVCYSSNSYMIDIETADGDILTGDVTEAFKSETEWSISLTDADGNAVDPATVDMRSLGCTSVTQNAGTNTRDLCLNDVL